MADKEEKGTFHQYIDQFAAAVVVITVVGVGIYLRSRR